MSDDLGIPKKFSFSNFRCLFCVSKELLLFLFS